MPTLDGATTVREELRRDANVTHAVAQTQSGADLEFAKFQRFSGGVKGSGADVDQADAKCFVVACGESTYAAAGGKVTRIIGQGFQAGPSGNAATAVQFGGTPGTAFSIVNDKVIQVTTPAKGAGTYDLVVVHADGNFTLVNGVVFV